MVVKEVESVLRMRERGKTIFFNFFFVSILFWRWGERKREREAGLHGGTVTKEREKREGGERESERERL